MRKQDFVWIRTGYLLADRQDTIREQDNQRNLVLGSEQNANGAAYSPTIKVNYDRWNIAAGSTGTTATAKDDSKSQVFAGGTGGDTFTGGSKADTFLAGAGNDELNGGAGNDLLYGGADNDTYNFTDAFGKDTVIDSDGLGQIKIGGKEVGTAKGAGKRGVWVADLGGGDFAWLAVYDDASSSTGKKLIITRASDADNTITINNFNLAKAEGNESYLGIKLDPTQSIAIVQGTGISVGASKPNVWADNNFNATSLDGKSSNVNEGAGKSFNIYLAQGAKAGAQRRRRVSLKSGDTCY